MQNINQNPSANPPMSAETVVQQSLRIRSIQIQALKAVIHDVECKIALLEKQNQEDIENLQKTTASQPSQPSQPSQAQPQTQQKPPSQKIVPDAKSVKKPSPLQSK